MPDDVADPGVCFPHPAEWMDVLPSVGLVVPWYLKSIVLHWRAGYLNAGHPDAGEFDGIGLRRASNYRARLRQAYRTGFRQRRTEIYLRARAAADPEVRAVLAAWQ